VFSYRTSWPREPNRLSAALAAQRKDGRRIIDLTESNPTTCGVTYPQASIIASLAHPDVLTYSPQAHGMQSARKRVAAYYREKDAIIHPTFLFLTASTSEAYSHLLTLLCDSGDNVLVPRPSYPVLDHLAQLHDVELRHYALRYDDGWYIDMDSLRDAITPRTKAIAIVQPHNPAGHFIKRDEHRMLTDIALQHGCALIVDEVFIDYPLTDNHDRLGTTADTHGALTFTLNGISKSCGLPQMKLGWIAVSGPDHQVIEASQRLEILCDTYLSVSTPIQLSLPMIFHAGRTIQRQILNRIHTNYALLWNALKDSSCSVLKSEGGWYAVVRVPATQTDEEWALELLSTQGLYVHPGYFFDFEEGCYLVVSLIVPETAARQAAEIFANIG
jgi:alanine-synthesizing transaminase